MKQQLLKLVLVLSCLVPLAAFGESEALDTAKWAVRQEIRARYGSTYRVTFEAPTEKILSLSEETVSGKAHLRDNDDWDIDRTFTYSVKVKYDGSSTRDLSIDFSDGEKVKGKSDWQEAKKSRSYVRLSSPHWYEKFDSGEVTFEGESSGQVNITVFDKKNKSVAQGNANSRNGKFRLTLLLPEGQLRAVVTTNGADDSEEVRFSVSDDSHDWGHPAPSFRMEEPGKGASVKGPRVTFSGQSSERTVRVQIWDAANNRVVDRDVPARDYYWNTQVELRDGSYRVQVDSGRASETRRFNVWTNSKPPSFERSFLKVSEPTNNSTFATSRVTASGNSSARSVRVEVLDQSDNRVLIKDIPVKDGYWNGSLQLRGGNYTLKISNPDSNLIEMRSIRVKGSDKPSAGLMVAVKVNNPKRRSRQRAPRNLRRRKQWFVGASANLGFSKQSPDRSECSDAWQLLEYVNTARTG
ncbi:MAG: hypothetical protein K1X67_03885 [Fimbriimonadaceae bacterium]|nr:hypothetical protein [Fimbriimonadaceae bacterium]